MKKRLFSNPDVLLKINFILNSHCCLFCPLNHFDGMLCNLDDKYNDLSDCFDKLMLFYLDKD